MRVILNVIPLVAGLVLVAASSAEAQNAQQWLNNQESHIQQQAAGGMINSGQATQMETRDAQIQAQANQMMSQNGGTLTPQENQQISHELRRNGRRDGRDMRSDNGQRSGSFFPAQQWMNGGNPQGGYPQGRYPQGGYPQGGYPQGGFAQNGMNGFVPQQGWNGYQNNAGMMNGAGFNPQNQQGWQNGQSGQNGQQWQHHHRGFMQQMMNQNP